MIEPSVELVGAGGLAASVLALIGGLWLGKRKPPQRENLWGIGSENKEEQAAAGGAIEAIVPLPIQTRYELLREHAGEFVPTGEFFWDYEESPHDRIERRGREESVAFSARIVDPLQK